MSAVEQTKQGITVKPPKTRHGPHDHLAPVTVDMLRPLWRPQQEQWLALGRGAVATGTPVFATVDGEIMSPRSISKGWERVTRRLGIKASFHATRHYHACRLIADMIDMVTVSRRLDHSSPAVTLKVYAHLMKSDARAAKVIQRALAKAQNECQNRR